MNLVEFKINKCSDEAWWYHSLVGKNITINLDTMSMSDEIYYEKTGTLKYNCLYFDIIDKSYLKIYHNHNGVESFPENTRTVILLDDINYLQYIRKKKIIELNNV